MKVKLSFQKETKIRFDKYSQILLFIIIISFPFIIYSNDITTDYDISDNINISYYTPDNNTTHNDTPINITTGDNNAGNNIADSTIVENVSDTVSCDAKNYLWGNCNLTFKNDDEKQLFKSEVVGMLINGELSDLIHEIIFENKEVIIREETESYQIISELDEKLYDNLTFVNFTQCMMSLMKKHNWYFNIFLLFKIEHYLPEYNFPILEYILFTSDGSIDFCYNETLQYYIPMSNINEKELYIYNISSDYYNDECSIYETIYGTDITMYNRKTNFNYNALSPCELNCTFIGYNNKTSRVECDCQLRAGFLSEKDLSQINFIHRFDPKQKISNLYVLKCYRLITSVDDIKSNPGFYITSIFLFFFILIFFIFLCKGYSSLSQRIDQAIKIKFHKSNKEKEKDDKLIIIKVKKDILGSSKTIKRNNIITKTNQGKKPNGKRVKKIINSSVKQSTFGSKNIFFDKRDRNERINIRETSGKENFLANKDENIYIFENDFELNMIPFQEALKCDKRTLCQFYCSFLKTKQLIILSFCDYNSYNSAIVNKTIFFLSFVYHYGINAAFFTDKNMKIIYDNEGAYNVEIFQNAAYSSLVSTVIIRLMTEFLILTERGVLIVKRQKTEDKAKENKARVMKIICIKFVFFFLVNFLMLFFFWFYLTCFNALYPKTQLFLLINTLISFALSNIYPFLICLIPAIFRSDILNRKKKGKKEKKKSEEQKKDAEYVYSVSQFLQNI